MTKQRDFKTLVRERMTKTGERYAAARASILQRIPATDAGTRSKYPGVLAGYERFGGIQAGTAPLTNVLRHEGVLWGVTRKPFTETAVNGLCGGPGFLYAVFEYKGLPPFLSIALQSRSMPDAFIHQGLERLGVRMTRQETTSPIAARKALEATLAGGRAALCAAGLRTVAVVGRMDDDWWIDGRAPVPTRLSSERLARQRAANKPAKHRLTRVDEPDPSAAPLASLRGAIVDTAKAYVEPPVPKSFWSNCGLAGLGKWQKMLTETKDRKGWPTLFDQGPRAFAGLVRAYEWVACRVAPGAGRPLYADFLDEAAAILNEAPLRSAADAFREAGKLWTSLGGFIATVDDDVIREGCQAVERALEDQDSAGDCHSFEDPMEMVRQRQTIGERCRLSRAGAQSIYAELAGRLKAVILAEGEAVSAMRGVGRDG